MDITRRTFLAGAVAGIGMETARAAGTGPSAGAETPKGAPNVTFGVLSDVHLERRGDEDTLLKALAYFRDNGADGEEGRGRRMGPPPDGEEGHGRRMGPPPDGEEGRERLMGPPPDDEEGRGRRKGLQRKNKKGRGRRKGMKRDGADDHGV